MTRGKNGAAAAARRAESAATALAEFQAEATAREAELMAEIRSLRAENQQLAGSLLSRAKEHARADVARIREEHAVAVRQVEEDCADRIRAAFKILAQDDAFRINMDLLPQVSKTLGVTPLDLLPGAATTRTSRRNLSSAKKVRSINAYHAQTREGRAAQ